MVQLIKEKLDADATAPHRPLTPEQREPVTKVLYTLGKMTQYFIFLLRTIDVGLLLLFLYLWFHL